MIRIKDLTDPRVAPYLTLRSRLGVQERDAVGLSVDDCVFVVDSQKVVQALLDSSIEVISVLAEPRYYARWGEGLLHRVPIDARYVAGPDLMEKIVGYRLHQGVMALARCPCDVPLDALGSSVVALNGLANVDNVGAVARNCAAFGASSVIVDAACASPFHRRAVRVSMGTVFGLKTHRSPCLVESLQVLKSRGYAIISADKGRGAVPLESVTFPDQFVLVIGSEDSGIDPDVLKACDSSVMIRIASTVDSLNAAAATAVLLHRANLQR